MESPFVSGDYGTVSLRGLRGGSCGINDFDLASSLRSSFYPGYELNLIGFRVASVPKPPIPGDADLDGDVDLDDASIVLAHWLTAGNTWAEGDFDGNGIVMLDDASLLILNWGTGLPSAPVVTPEPATLSLLAIGGLAMLRRRRK